VNGGLENTLEEMTVAYLTQQSLGGSSKEKPHNNSITQPVLWLKVNPKSCSSTNHLIATFSNYKTSIKQPVSWPRFDPKTSQIQSLTATFSSQCG
jgi:hypothetical protein